MFGHLKASYPTLCRDELSDGASGDESFDLDGSSALLKITCAHYEATSPRRSKGVGLEKVSEIEPTLATDCYFLSCRS